MKKFLCPSAGNHDTVDVYGDPPHEVRCEHVYADGLTVCGEYMVSVKPFECFTGLAGCLCLECQWRWEVQGIEALMMRGMTCPRWDLHEKAAPVGVSNAVRHALPGGK